MFDWLDHAREVMGYIDEQITKRLRQAGILDQTIDADALRGQLNDSVVIPLHAATHEAGGTDEIDLGSLAGELTNTQHGARAGGTLHAIATTLLAGFMSATDKVKLDGIGSGANVTSVALSAPSHFSVTGSPGTGAVSLALAWATGQTQNRVLASPDGSSGAISLRALVAADIPTLAASKISGTAVVLTVGGTQTIDSNLTITKAAPQVIINGDGSSTTVRYLVQISASNIAHMNWNNTSAFLDIGTLSGVAGSVRLLTGASSRMIWDDLGNIVAGVGLATSATDGFLYIPSCAGTPSGTPTTFTNRVPLVYDRTNNILYAYSGGAWRTH